VIVVGGIYEEICHEPVVEWVFGSGTRATAIARSSVEAFISASDPDSLGVARAALGGDIEVRADLRERPIGFVYDTPISANRLYGQPKQQGEMLAVEADQVLAFGLVEVPLNIRARQLVLDPQHSISVAEIQTQCVADDLVVVANVAEVRKLGASRDAVVAARRLLSSTHASVVVVKAAALGALIVTEEEVIGIPALPTSRVFPIGSGDAFSAGFADAYFGGAGLKEAAIRASFTAAGYCATRQTGPVTFDPEFEVRSLTPELLHHPPIIYVAASFATPEQRWLARTAAQGIADIGAQCVYPLRDYGPVEDVAETAALDLDGLESCGSVLLLADSARTGPLFETGWAAKLKIPIVVASSDLDPTRFTMLRGTGAHIFSDLSTAAYQAVWRNDAMSSS
jgi:hypothetical protein